MSWVKAVGRSVEDVFDEDADDITLQNKEWKYNMEKRVKVKRDDETWKGDDGKLMENENGFRFVFDYFFTGNTWQCSVMYYYYLTKSGTDVLCY